MNPRVALLMTLLALLAGALPAAAQNDFRWEVGDRGAITEMSVIHTFYTYVINTGSQTDTYTVDFTATLPQNWFSSLCEGEFCYAPFPIVTRFTFELAPGDTNQIGVNMTPVTFEGSGEAVITVSSQNDPTLQETVDFAVFSDGMDVLVVDDDPNGEPGPWLTDALAGTGLVSGVWVRDSMGLLAAADLGNYATVLWSTGDDGTPVASDDRDALRAYVEAGGQLYMSGADLAHGLGDPLIIFQVAWMQSVLGATYVADNAGSGTVAGVAGDALGDGLAFGITGGDGAGNNGAPDELGVAPGGTAWAEYPGGAVAATRMIVDRGRAVLTGFAFEGVATGAQRQSLLAAIMEWLASSSPSAVGDLPRVLLTHAVARPNPFNPQTTIAFALGGARAVAASVDIYDLRGRNVRHLFAGSLEPGPQRLTWNGRDNDGRGLPSGIYLARVRAAEQTVTVKMTLAK